VLSLRQTFPTIGFLESADGGRISLTVRTPSCRFCNNTVLTVMFIINGTSDAVRICSNQVAGSGGMS
jgi:hypothetical protein